jgi:hypothetical protein
VVNALVAQDEDVRERIELVNRINTISSGGDADMIDRKERIEYLKAWKEWIGYWVVIFGMWGTSLWITLTFTN